MHHHWLILLLAGLLACGGSPPRENNAASGSAARAEFALAGAANETIATVDGFEITGDQILARANERSHGAEAASARVMLDSLIDDQLLAAEASRLGLAADPAVQRAVENARHQTAAALLEKELAKDGAIDEAVLRKMYHDTTDAVTLEGVVLSTEKAARESLTRLRAGTPLAEECQGSLDMRSAQAGGQMGTIMRAQLTPEIAAIVFSAPLDTFLEPFRRGDSWAVLRVTKRTLGDDEGFAARRDSLRRYAAQQLAGEAKRHLVKMKRATLAVTVDLAFLERTGTKLDATEEERAHVLARIGDRVVRYGDVLDTMRQKLRLQSDGHMAGISVKTSIAERIVDELVFEHAAVERGLGASPEAESAVASAERLALNRAIRSKLVTDVPAPTAAEIEAYYRAHERDYLVPARRRIAHILASSEADAKNLRKRLDAGAPFAEVAMLSKDDKTRRQGGRLGEMPDAQIDAIEDSGEAVLAAALRGKPGVISQPVQSRFGWHLVLVEEHIPAAPAPLDQVANLVELAVKKQRGEAQLAARLTELRSAATIEIDEAALAEATRWIDDMGADEP